jgi:anaerobic glycerol-3-phosphate dehydrogenase
MSDMYLVNLDLEAIDKLRSKAYEGRKLSVAVFVDKSADEDWKKLNITFGNKKAGEEVVRLGNASKAFIREDSEIKF